MNIFIEGNISQALEFLKDSTESDVYFVLPDSAKGMRKKKLEEDLEFLKTQVTITSLLERKYVKDYIKEYDHYFGWNSFDENVEYKDLKTHPQNRLFDEYDFESIETFTPFKKQAEKLLPKRYENNIFQEQDNEVLDCLSYYFEKTHLAQTYFETRNGVIGRDYSTKFSRFLSNGRLNVRYLYNYLKEYEEKYGSNKSTYWIQFEILWREFFYWSYQKNKTSFFSLNGLKGKREFKRDYSSNLLSYLKGDEFMECVLKELFETGFISNRFRQVFASEWIHKYKFDWRDGAYLFECYLADYDVYSNWGNWQYLAGVGHDPRGKRRFNVLKQLDTYDPKREYLKKWKT